MAADDYLVKWSRAGHLRHTGRVCQTFSHFNRTGDVASPLPILFAGLDIH